MLQIFIQMVVTCVLSRVLKICAFHPMHLNTSMSRCTNLPRQTGPATPSMIQGQPQTCRLGKCTASSHRALSGRGATTQGEWQVWEVEGTWLLKKAAEMLVTPGPVTAP